MNRTPWILTAVLMGSCLIPSLSYAISRPSSLTVRSGYVAFENLYSETHPAAISISSSWDLGKQTAFWSSIGYVRETGAASYISPLRQYGPISDRVYSTGPVRVHLIPISAGFRAYANDPLHRSRGLFVEAGPSLGAAAYRGSDGATHPAALGGLQCGMGVRFAVDGSRFELGGSYQMAEGIGRYGNALGRLGTPRAIDYHLFSVYLGIGFGN